MKCPKCEATLSQQMVGDIEIDHCPNCRGVWLDLGELKALLNASPKFQSALEQTTTTTTGEAGLYDALTGVCPRCGGRGHMTRVQNLDRPDVTMDSCPVCFGIWLDGGEFSQLASNDLMTTFRAFLGRNFGV